MLAATPEDAASKVCCAVLTSPVVTGPPVSCEDQRSFEDARRIAQTRETGTHGRLLPGIGMEVQFDAFTRIHRLQKLHIRYRLQH